jgi:hypothetical protein
MNLPLNQWYIEVESRFAISLAELQEAALEFAAGHLDLEIAPYVQYPTDTGTARLCNNQLAQVPPGYTDFDFGVTLVSTAVGIVFFVVGMLFERVARRDIKNWRGLAEGRENGKFQSLKRMYETQNRKGPKNPREDVPISLVDPPSLASVTGAENQRVSGGAQSAQGSSYSILPTGAENISSGNAGSGSGGPSASANTRGAHSSTAS